MAQSRYYSSGAAATTLTASVTNSATTILVGAVTGFPVSYPYTLILDKDTASEEIVTVTAGSGTTLTVTRGQDGTAGVSHSLGVSVIHGVSARDFTEPSQHIGSSAGVHGVTGSVVGTTDTQALTHKDLTDATNSFPPSLVTLTGTQNLTNKTLTDAVAQASATTTKALLVKPQASPTANILEVQDGSNNVAARIYKGAVFFTTELDTILNVNAGVNSVNAGGLTSIVPLMGQGASGQVANLMELRDGGGALVVSVDTAGNFTSTNFKSGAWTSYTPSWTATTTNPVIGNGSIAGRYKQIDKVVICEFRLVPGSTTTFGSGNYRLSLPVTSATLAGGTSGQIGTALLFAASTSFGGCLQVDTNNIAVYFHGLTGQMTPTAPVTFANGNDLRIFYTYEAA